VVLDTELTPELKKKGAYRELVRNINDLRKGARLTIGDRIVLHWQSDGEFWKEVMAEAGDRLATDVLADRLTEERVETEHNKEIQSDDQKIWLGIVKV
jgi:isoleucyl-tRNA synthetase